MATVLTDAAIRKFRPGAKRRVIRDAGAQSLYLVIATDGAKSFWMRFRDISGRPAKMVIGYYDLSGHEPVGEPQIGAPLTLAGARRLAADIHRKRLQGHDVVGEHKLRNRQRHTLHANTYAAAVQSYVKEHVRPNVRRWRDVVRRLGVQPDNLELTPNGLVERWGDRAVGDITSADIWDVIDEARRVGIPGIVARTPGLSEPRADQLRSALSGMFARLHQNRRLEQNPFDDIPRQKGAARARERVLTAGEIKLFWRACGEVGEPFATIYRLLLLTGQRREEVAGMRRGELQGDTWRIPGSRTKNGKPHEVPLSSTAMKLISSADGDLLFSTNGRTPPTTFGFAKTKLDAAITKTNGGRPLTSWVIHDLRRTAVTGMGDLGVRTDVIELIVNHTSGARGGIAGVYNRSKLLDERRRALEQWAQQIERIVR